jgi:hypothetical protein
MELLLVSPLLVAVTGGLLYLLISTLLDAARLKGSDQIVWICIIAFAFPIGSLVYLLVKPRNKK